MSRYALRLVGWDVSWTLLLVVPVPLRPRRGERRFFLAGAACGAEPVAAAECDLCVVVATRGCDLCAAVATRGCDLRAGDATGECDLRAGRDRRAAWEDLSREDLSRDGDGFLGVGASAYGLSWGGRGKTGYWVVVERGRQAGPFRHSDCYPAM